MPAFRAPGRVNLIGGQVDYHEGWVVPMAIDRDVVVEATPRDDGRVVARRIDLDGTVDVAADGRDDRRVGRSRRGAARSPASRACSPSSGARRSGSTSRSRRTFRSAPACRRARRSRSRARSRSTTPRFALAGDDLALAAQRAEHVATGVPCGIQDQMASVHGRADHALFLDCRTLAIEHLPLPDDLRVLVVHSGVPRTLEGTPYAQRRAESLDVATQLGLRVLRDATLEQVRDTPRGRHVVTEMLRVQRVRDCAAARTTSTRSAR